MDYTPSCSSKNSDVGCRNLAHFCNRNGDEQTQETLSKAIYMARSRSSSVAFIMLVSAGSRS